MSSSQASPFLRWAGSKRQLLPVLSQYWKPTYRRYVEPFAGSACLFFRLHPRQAVLGDINPELIAAYREVRDDPSRVAESLGKLEKGKEAYLRLRSTAPDSLEPHARAARFLYLNRFCFNGLYRTNQSGRFNVPYGGDSAGQPPSEEALLACAERLQSAALVAADFDTVLKHVREGDFVYMDPPFVVEGRRIFTEYHRSPFAAGDVSRLRCWMELLARRGIPFLISYAQSAEADFLSQGFHTKVVTVRRNIAGFAGSRGESKEMLISNVSAGG